MQRRLIVAVLLAVVGCKKAERPPAPPPVPPDPVVATFAGHAITAGDLQRYFSEQSPFVQTHYQDQGGKMALLETMIQAQLIADQAVKDGFEHDDEALSMLRKSMIMQWKHAKFDDAEGERNLSEAALRAYYDAHRADYQRPDKARVRMVFFKAAPGHEAAAEADAEAALKSLSEGEAGTAFSRLARTRSDDTATRNKQGDLGDFLSHADLAKSYGEAVAAAADSLSSPGDVSQKVAHGTGGFYLLQLEGRNPGDQRSFEAAEPSLRARLWGERRRKQDDDFMKDMLERAQVQIDETELAKVNRGPSAEVAPQPALPNPPPAIEEQIKLPLPPYREDHADTLGPAVATFGGHRITTAELTRYFEEQSPYVRSHFETEDAKKGMLDEIIQSQLMVDEALKGGFDKDPVSLDRYKKSMVGAWMEDHFDAAGERNLSEAELRAFYDAHRADYQHAERSFEASQKDIRTRLWEEERRGKAFEAFMNGLLEQAHVKIDEVALGGVKLTPAKATDEAGQVATAPPAPPWEKLRTPLAPTRAFPYTQQTGLTTP